MRNDIKDMTQGKWTGILGSLGIPSDCLRDRHGPCPMCGGTDRFRYDNKDGRGTYICNQCGSGDGWALLMGYRGWDFKEAVREVRQVLGVVDSDPAHAEREVDHSRLKSDLWKASHPIQKGDLADRYLESRNCCQGEYPKSLRFCDSAYYAPNISYPCMVALVSPPDGKSGYSLHRTYLDRSGGKAPVEDARRLMPGKVTEGSAIRLGDPGEVLGIAEGIETALCAAERFRVPTWAAISSTLLERFEPPHHVKELVIFGDNDPGFAGQAAAYQLAKRMVGRKLKVSVHIPDLVGTDWADVP